MKTGYVVVPRVARPTLTSPGRPISPRTAALLRGETLFSPSRQAGFSVQAVRDRGMILRTVAGSWQGQPGYFIWADVRLPDIESE